MFLNVVIGTLFTHILSQHVELERRVNGLSERDVESTSQSRDRLQALIERVDRIQARQDRVVDDLAEMKARVSRQTSPP